MATEKRLIPFGEKVSLYDLPFGAMFAFGDDCIALKSEYTLDNGLIEAHIIDSGEQFWGGAKTAKEQNELMVQPLVIEEVDAVEVVHGRWIHVPSSDMMTGKAYKCSECGKMRYGSYMPNYCQCCGAKMDGDGNE